MLDHLEGNLSPQDTLALKAFAILHPELELNFDDELVSLENESITFGGKQNLKAGFSDELVIGYLENVLEGEEKKEAEKLAQNNTVFKHELDLYKKTIAVADNSIVFENKERLKRRSAIIFFPQNNYIRVAAALLLLVGLWFMVSRIIKDDLKVTPEIANKLKEEKIVPLNNAPIENQTNASELKDNTNELIAKNTSKQSTVTTNKEKENLITSTISINVPNEKQEPQLADRSLNKEQPENRIETNNGQLANTTTSEKTGPKYIIEEGADDEVVVAQPKSKLWNAASGLLKRLNRRGVENVNSSENNNEMFIGALTISKPN